MSSQTEIANLALRRFGQSRITDINQSSAAAEALRDVWDSARRAALRCHTWNFATKAAVLTASATVPLFKWAKQFPLPGDYLRLISVNNVPCGTNLTWCDVQSGMLMSHESTAEIEYTADVTECEDWDDQFVEMLSFKLAAMVAPALMADGGAAAATLANAEFIKLLQAMSSNAIEGRPRVINALSGSSYLAARAGGVDDWPPYREPGEGIPLAYGVQFNPYNVT